MAYSWNDELTAGLTRHYAKKASPTFKKKYQLAFPPAYQEDNNLAAALRDIQYIEGLSDTTPIKTCFYFTGKTLHLRIFQYQNPLYLSHILPTLTHFGLIITMESPYQLRGALENVWISDFTVIYTKPLDLKIVDQLFHDAFAKIMQGLVENDGFNELILACELPWRIISVFRAYTKYLKQINFRFNQLYIEKTLIHQAAITRLLAHYFAAQHDPQYKGKKSAPKIFADITKALKNVSSLDEDFVIRRILELMSLTLRTNFFQREEAENSADVIAFKLDSRKISNMPQPTPLFEIFVYGTRMEGIHLRNSEVARGGIRWSDRNEDFRTEILGLMKAQTVKNAVIVPSGAKGGFVLKRHVLGDRQALLKEGIACYQILIRSMLSLTDNIINKKIIRPKNIICHDKEPDAYLVVAADKGTASFSDIANQLSLDAGFWLNDAFASGGSAGYDHKKMGITARGAFESIKRHFRELEIDITRDPISVVGIGDMSGDVFGNGLTYCKNLRLIAAFDHRDIFLDPDPNLAVAYRERVRLFKLPTSSWQDYNKSMISPGGGVYARSLKAIPINEKIKKLLAITDDNLTPDQLIRALLKAPVDLLFNGGIGTYVKASDEVNAEVGDRTNDYTRIDGNELRCKVVGEGGNLGFTQRARIEYALNQGLINTDFIDNSAGVDCSDHEVNLKILLNAQMKKGKLSLAKRNTLLFSLTAEIAALVLRDNFEQAYALSYAAHHAKRHISLDTSYIKELETRQVLKRKLEFLPDEKQLNERKAAKMGLTRPEIATLLSYSKISLKSEILQSTIPEEPYFAKMLNDGFPQIIGKKFAKELANHTLKREIIATQISNEVVNEMGISFIYRIQSETGASAAEIVKNYAIAAAIFDIKSLQETIQNLELKISMTKQYEMIYNLRTLIYLATRWFLKSAYIHNSIQKTIHYFAHKIKQLETIIPPLMSGLTQEYLTVTIKEFKALGLEGDAATKIAAYRAMYSALNIIEITSKYKVDLNRAAEIYLKAGEKLKLVWFRDQVSGDKREGYTNALARLALRDELDAIQRDLAMAIIKHNPQESDSEKLIASWMSRNARALHRWDIFLALILEHNTTDYTLFFIALRELLNIIQATLKKSALLNP